MTTAGALTFREGSVSDLETTFELAKRAVHESGVRQSVIAHDDELTEAEIQDDWQRRRAFVEHIAAQPDGRYVICEDGAAPIAYARVVRYGAMEELTELMVLPEHRGQGIARRLLEIAWPGDPTPELGRVVVATGAPSDLSLYTGYGVMPVGGHWHMRIRTDAYQANRSLEVDAVDPAVHALKDDRAVAAWKRLEPPAIGHERPSLHEFFGRDRTCLGVLDPETGEADAVCWVSSDGDIGPAVARDAGGLVPLVIAALDRVAATQEPAHLSVYTSTLSWWLLRRLRTLGFSVYWPSWILCSEPLPGLDRYMPTRPPHVL